MLKPLPYERQRVEMLPAAFRRLCVETQPVVTITPPRPPAAFRRLCVETPTAVAERRAKVPAAFRRLCVETLFKAQKHACGRSSRLQAAVC